MNILRGYFCLDIMSFFCKKNYAFTRFFSYTAATWSLFFQNEKRRYFVYWKSEKFKKESDALFFSVISLETRYGTKSGYCGIYDCTE